MKRKLLVLLLPALLGFTAKAQTVYTDYMDGRIWLKIKDNTPIWHVAGTEMNHNNMPLSSLPFIKQMASEYKITRLSRPFHMVKNEKKLSNVFLVEFSEYNKIDLFIRQLQETGKLDYAEKVPLTRTTLTPNDPNYNASTQWSLFKINASNAWNVSTGNTSIVVAIVDDAVKITHPDLAPNVWINTGEIANNGLDDDNNGYVDDREGYDVADMDADPNPPTNSFDHGTHVAGISGARSNNSAGVASIGYSIKLMAVKSSNQVSLVTDGYDGIVYATINGANVINMSWGGSGSSTTAQNIITWSNAQGCLLIAAAGNDNVSSIFYPAGYTEVIAVASTTTNDAKSSFSNYGSWIDVSSPGSSIYSTIPASNGYAYKDGTSMASPLVAGLAGLVWSVNPSLTNNDVKSCILSTADNINAVNGSFIGQLGSGRINAQAAVNCASATLNWPPVADFSGLPTTITAGSSVTFTNLSTYNPTSYSWSFTGGTPATSTAANPPAITYNTPGTYTVALTATNANGNDTETKTAYITVTPNTGCDTLNFSPLNSPYSSYVYNAGPGNGFVAGTNVYGDKAKANYMNAAPYTYITHAIVWVAKAHSLTPSKTVDVFVKNGTGGTVGATLANGSVTLTMADLMFDVANNYLTIVEFPAPVLLPASKLVFVGVDHTNLTQASGDSLCFVTTYQNEINPGNGWEQMSNNAWQTYMTGWGIHLDNYISAVVTDNPAVATITATPTTLCSGNSVSFNAGSSTYDEDLLWTVPGGSPVQSGNPAFSAFYNTPGTYQAYLEVLGGSCGAYAVDSVTITVNPTPTINITQSNDTICPGGTVNLTASGATTYSWSPATALNNAAIANPTSTPTSTITYTVTGTTGACQGNQFVNIVVFDQSPVADFITDLDTACTGQPFNVNGSVSTGETSYSWTFTGASISSSTSPSTPITYAAAGTFPIELVVQNTCGFDDTLIQNIVVENCSGIGELNNSGLVKGFINPDNNHVYVTFQLQGERNMKLDILDATGRIVYSGSQNITYKGQTLDIDATQMARGVYTLRVAENDQQYVMKFYR